LGVREGLPEPGVRRPQRLPVADESPRLRELSCEVERPRPEAELVLAEVVVRAEELPAHEPGGRAEQQERRAEASGSHRYEEVDLAVASRVAGRRGAGEGDAADEGDMPEEACDAVAAAAEPARTARTFEALTQEVGPLP